MSRWSLLPLSLLCAATALAGAAPAGPAGARGGTAGRPTAVPADVPAAQVNSAESAGTQAEYVLRPFDRIKIEVFREPELTREPRLTQDSTVTLPLIESVNLKGLTVREAEARIRDLYIKMEFLVNPQVSLIVTEYSKREVKILGNVANPGAVIIPPDRPLRLSDAISGAGGTARLAALNRLTLTRVEADGRRTTIDINFQDILDGKSPDPILQDGDTVNVPERIL